MTNKDSEFQDALKRTLAGADEALPEDIRIRLRSARKRALAAADVASTPTGLGQWLLPAAGLATIAVIAISMVLWLDGGNGLPTQAVNEDMELLLSTDSLELYANLDFYRWLDTTYAG